MSIYERHAENDYGASASDNDPRPRYIELGVDDSGAVHYYNTRTETIRVVDDRVQIECLDVSQRPVDDYIRFLRDEVEGRDWVDRRYLLPEESVVSALNRDPHV